jgi:ribosome maturation factor RimP
LSENKLTNLISPLVEELGYEFVGLEHSSNPKNALLRVYIDQEEGIDLDDCSRVSRELAALLDVEDPISGHYNLEISSPGLDRPLFTLEHYEQFAGSEVKITLFSPEDGRRKFRGLISGVLGDSVQLNVDGVEVALKFGNIAKAKLVPDYDGIIAARNQKAKQAGQ